MSWLSFFFDWVRFSSFFRFDFGVLIFFSHFIGRLKTPALPFPLWRKRFGLQLDPIFFIQLWRVPFLCCRLGGSFPPLLLPPVFNIWERSNVIWMSRVIQCSSSEKVSSRFVIFLECLSREEKSLPPRQWLFVALNIQAMLGWDETTP